MAAVDRVILWDVDGTLVRTGGVGAEAFATAIETLFGVAAAGHGVSLAGKTDPQIAREILTVLDLHHDAERHLPRLLAETERLVAAGQDRIRARGQILPGVPALLEALARPGTVQTVLTGNTAANAAVKLDAFGLRRWLDLDVGAFGSDDADRNALVGVALSRIERRHGPVDRHRVWVVGDTPLDAACARSGGVHCLLVASGFADRAALDAAGADHVVDDLTDTGAILARLDSADPPLSDVDRRVRAALDALGVVYTVVPCDPELADTAAFCAAYGYDTGDSANTIIVQSRDKPPRHVACVLLATTRLDVNGTVRIRLGRKASFADAEHTTELSGMTLGGVTAVGLPPGLPVWIDARVMERERVILGAGSRHWKVIAAPGFLATLPGAEVVEGLAREV